MLVASLVLLALSIGLYVFMLDRLLRFEPPLRARIVGTPVRIFILSAVRIITSGAAYAGVWYSAGLGVAAAVYVSAWGVRTFIRTKIRASATEKLVAELAEWQREEKGTLSHEDLASIQTTAAGVMRERMRGEG